MTGVSETQDQRLSVLGKVFAEATQHAAAAMCRWTNGLISVTLDEVRSVPLEELQDAVGVGDQMLTMVVVPMYGQVGGSWILAFDERNARQLAASLLGGDEGTAPQWSELEKSALTETGNILGCAYANALAQLTGVDLVPSAPCFIQDFGASVLQQAVAPQALRSDHLLLCHVRFCRLGQELDWQLIFLPTQSMQETIHRSLSMDS
mgnify:CR=1 FL=1